MKYTYNHRYTTPFKHNRSHKRRKLKSSFKTRKRRKKMRVRWSPDVKNIVRKSKKSRKIESSKLLLKIGDKKTDHEIGYLHATLNKNILLLTLKQNRKTISTIKINVPNKTILSVEFSDIKITTASPSTKVKLKFDLGNVIWTQNGKRYVKKFNSTGFNVSWLSEIITFYGNVHYKHKISKKYSMHFR